MKRKIDITKLSEDELKCSYDVLIEDGRLSFNWETWFDVDNYFGTNTQNDDTWLNFYTDYYRETGEIKAVYALDTPAHFEEVEWELTNEEKEFLKERMLKFSGYPSLEEFYDRERYFEDIKEVTYYE